MSKIHFYSENINTQSGKSQGLVRGLLARYDSRDLAQEGMGIGSIAMKSGPFTYFASTGITETINARKILKTFLIDSRLLVCCGAHSSLLLTLASEKMVDYYMKYPVLQKTFLACGPSLRRLAKISFRREYVPAMAKASFTYEINELTLKITCRLSLFRKKACKVYILNELGADYFTKSLRNDAIARAPSGWEPIPLVTTPPALFDEENGIAFSIHDYAPDPKVPLHIFWGREKSPSLCWAGFEFELDIPGGQAGETSLGYTVELREREQS